ncbi:MAG TPA: MerR family transcriptional regulator [Methylococcaceae bacterium]|jgi:MerR family mercuric resistance operon transcriptional regulator|nr:MerR family transcriptional regulator [Methylococcaceae bacterium]HIB62279.1 MerR family transcriptional regulator [Methylococcaceae bacterium]HIN68294.1 MerR family transcriptional regulator [Methylococcales bacterium]HIO12054.1 MerR family transcriptional regulator [Methylococcales bacterium]HIO45348.1 MerR family transcriptional regulator [Methylococcales bacterium]
MSLTIGQLAKQAGVTIETIRFYQRKSLLVEPKKPSHGFRHYPQESIAQIRFIKRAQKYGFSLKEISELLSIHTHHCEEIRKIAELKYQQIDTQIKDLTILRHALNDMIKRCQNEPSSEHCSLIDTFFEDAS